MKHLCHSLQNFLAFSKSVESLSTDNEYVYAICCRREKGNDVIYDRNVKAILGYIVVNFEVASSSSFRDFPERLFCDAEAYSGSGGLNAICSRLEVADDVISNRDLPGICRCKRVCC